MFRIAAWAETLSLRHLARPVLDPNQPYPLGTGVFSPGVKLNTHPHVVKRLRKSMELYIHSPICLHGVVLN
jgi:hypothetical protein